jgi:hypothetical protein
VNTSRLRSIVVAVTALFSACGGSTGPTAPGSINSTPTSPAGTLVLRASPIDQAAIRWITPLGNLNPPGHSVPTDHIYFYFADPSAAESPVARRVEFHAPGDGVVTTVLDGVGGDSKVFIRQTSTFTYYLDHLILSAPLARGAIITAGQVLGTTGGAYGVDLGVINESLNLNFIVPSHYISDTIHADGPLKYFDEPLRSQLYARVQRIGSDLDGKIDFDVAGRLSGNWFIGASAVLAFAYDTYDPSQVRVSSGTGAMVGVYAIGASDPLPADVSPRSGRVRYALSIAITGPPRPGTPTIAGYMLAEMIDDTHVKVETFQTVTAPADFTSAALTYSR